MLNLKDTGYITASRFSRLSSKGLQALKPITIILDGDKPVAVAIEHSHYLEIQSELEILQYQAELLGRPLMQLAKVLI